MNIENDTIQMLINGLLVIIPLAAVVRIVQCAVCAAADGDRQPEYRRRIRHVLLFVAFAECATGLISMLYRYYQ